MVRENLQYNDENLKKIVSNTRRDGETYIYYCKYWRNRRKTLCFALIAKLSRKSLKTGNHEYPEARYF